MEDMLKTRLKSKENTKNIVEHYERHLSCGIVKTNVSGNKRTLRMKTEGRKHMEDENEFLE